jgi:hypothetical protein
VGTRVEYHFLYIYAGFRGSPYVPPQVSSTSET